MNREERVAQLNRYFSENRIIRRKWEGSKADGRRVACALAALGRQGEINSPEKCPADLMPAWLAHLTPDFDDRTSDKNWHEIIGRYVSLIGKWHVLDANAWRRCQAKTMIAALEIAMQYDTANVVLPVIELMGRVAQGDEPKPQEWEIVRKSASEAAKAAEAEAAAAKVAAAKAAWAAWAAVWSATAEASWAAEAAWAAVWAAEAAKAAVWAAEAAAEAAKAVWAAEAAAAKAAEVWDKMATSCLNVIELEISLVQ